MSTSLVIRRLTLGDEELARALFTMMADVFEESSDGLSDQYVTSLLDRPSFWALVALIDGVVAGGLTAHTLPMTRTEGAELFIYDVAVREEYQRSGIGRELIGFVRTAAAAIGIGDVFVAADIEDQHALDFYRALGGTAAPVEIFTFVRQRPTGHRAQNQ